MKSIVMAVLLIAAVGAGVYFLFLNKKKPIVNNEIQKELIVGKWNLDSLSHVTDSARLFIGFTKIADSNFANYSYQFEKDGKVLRLFKDSIQKNNSRYEWTGNNQLLFKQGNDSIGINFIVSKLSSDSLVLQSKDSSLAFFTKIK